MAFDRVEPGMSKADVDAAMKGSFANIPTVDLAIKNYRQFTVTYYFDHSKIPVDFDREDRVMDKALVRFRPTPSERFRAWLMRARTAIGVY
jgi:hypothetical protein